MLLFLQMKSLKTQQRMGIHALSRSTLALSMAFAFSAHAQSTSIATLPETVVTASRTEQLVTDALPFTTVIGRDKIEQSQAVDLPTLLAKEAGFQVTQAGGVGMASTMYLRGSASMQVLVLIDGVPQNRQDTTGSVAVEQISLDQVERIEIVRGNVSAIYGSGAVGGVIQIFTRKGNGAPKGYALIEAGTYGSLRANVGVSGQEGDTHFAIGVGQRHTDGFPIMDQTVYPNENPHSHGYDQTNYNINVSQDWAQGQTIGLRVQGGNAVYKFSGGGFGSPTDVNVGMEDIGTVDIYSRNQLTSNWTSDLSFDQGQDRLVQDGRADAFYPWYSEAITQTHTARWMNTIALGGSWVATAGMDYQRQWIDTNDGTGPILSLGRNVRAYYAGVNGMVGANALQFNVRRDETDGLDGQNTGFLGYGFQATRELKFIASVSSAFNLPPLGYLYDPYSGNPNLKPESSRSFEWGVQWAKDASVLRVTNFTTRTTDLLLYNPNTYAFDNIASATIKGVEGTYSGKYRLMDVYGTLTVQNPQDDSTGQALIRRAQTLATLGINVPMQGWSFGGDVSYTGSRSDKGSHVLPEYWLVNANARYHINKDLDMTARIENLMNASYETVYGYNQPAISFYVGLVWNQK